MEKIVDQDKIFIISKNSLGFQSIIYLLDKSFSDNKESLRCYDISFPIMIEKKYNNSSQKGNLVHRAKYIFSENGDKIFEIKCMSNHNTIFWGQQVLSGIFVL